MFESVTGKREVEPLRVLNRMCHGCRCKGSSPVLALLPGPQVFTQHRRKCVGGSVSSC